MSPQRWVSFAFFHKVFFFFFFFFLNLFSFLFSPPLLILSFFSPTYPYTAQNTSDEHHYILSKYFLELSHREYNMLAHYPSKVAAAAMMISNKMLGRPWVSFLSFFFFFFFFFFFPFFSFFSFFFLFFFLQSFFLSFKNMLFIPLPPLQSPDFILSTGYEEAELLEPANTLISTLRKEAKNFATNGLPCSPTTLKYDVADYGHLVPFALSPKIQEDRLTWSSSSFPSSSSS